MEDIDSHHIGYIIMYLCYIKIYYYYYTVVVGTVSTARLFCDIAIINIIILFIIRVLAVNAFHGVLIKRGLGVNIVSQKI